MPIAPARAYDDWRSMLDKEHLDAVFICVPPFVHGPPEMELAERGIPFLVEKPLAVDAEIAEAIGVAVARAWLVTAVGYHWRWLDTLITHTVPLDDAPGFVNRLVGQRPDFLQVVFSTSNH